MNNEQFFPTYPGPNDSYLFALQEFIGYWFSLPIVYRDGRIVTETGNFYDSSARPIPGDLNDSPFNFGGPGKSIEPQRMIIQPNEWELDYLFAGRNENQSLDLDMDVSEYYRNN